jgi:NAD(P)-dependent dehydrogenase (short-subunit alcohol dehydrogenase family)
VPAPLADIPSDGFSVGIRTNINGTFYGMKHQIPAMLSSGGGVIINMASVAGLGATSNLAAYVSERPGSSHSANRPPWTMPIKESGSM